MYLGEDIVDEILSLLPVKSLLRFKVVCKDWYYHIQKDSFIAKHMKNQKSTNEKTLIYHKQCIQKPNNFEFVASIGSEQEIKEDDGEDDDSQIMFHQDQQYYVKDISLDYLRNYDNHNIEDVKRFSKLYHSYDMKRLWVNLVGSCNGIVCLNYCDSNWDKRIITLWNPATRDFKALPSCERPRSNNLGSVPVFHNFGFGFDCTSNDYKVVRVSYSFGDQRQRIEKAMIYSLNTNSWSRVDYSNVREITSRGNCYNTISLRENVYWVKLSFDMLQNPILLSFDMGKEVFQSTPLPLSIKLGFQLTKFLTLDESIALVHYRNMQSVLEIWTTKELEQGRESWIKVFNIAQFPKFDCPPVFRKWKNSDDFIFIFFHNIGEKRVMKGVYINDRGEAKDGKIMTIKVKNNVNRPLKVLTYIETLVSVNTHHV